ncbi:hypothetical protein Bca52824_016263 [Brassica carinata]|uniref:Uncharacterized protein n=1 Tax=Brassica carinata TaxID=52824 RepID=A0A8X8B585_BRACI|nr:hypothetical protein Bca52824_016263 [Brassica carinata]
MASSDSSNGYFLHAIFYSNTPEVRLLRFWEAPNVRKGVEQMSVDMLFLDEKVDSSSSYYQSDEIQGEEASELCLAGKRRKETERSSSALPPK